MKEKGSLERGSPFAWTSKLLTNPLAASDQLPGYCQQDEGGETGNQQEHRTAVIDKNLSIYPSHT